MKRSRIVNSWRDLHFTMDGGIPHLDRPTLRLVDFHFSRRVQLRGNQLKES